MTNAEYSKMITESFLNRKKEVYIGMGSNNGYVDADALIELIYTFIFFEPHKMDINHHWRNKKKIKYDEAEFKSALRNVVENPDQHYIRLYDKDDLKVMRIYLDNEGFDFVSSMPVEAFDKNKLYYLKRFQELFIRLDGVFGFMGNDFDISVIGDLKIRDIEKYGLTDDDFTGINDIPIIYSDFNHSRDVFDLSYLPQRPINLGHFHMPPAHYMWCGPDFMHIYGKEKVENFNKCIYNKEFSPDFREICLWENISEYNHPQFRESQWAFRKDLRLEETLLEFNDTAFLERKHRKKAYDPEVEMLTGTFPHGGDFLVKHYFTKRKKPISRSEAQICYEQEFKNNELIFEDTYKIN